MGAVDRAMEQLEIDMEEHGREQQEEYYRAMDQLEIDREEHEKQEQENIIIEPWIS